MTTDARIQTMARPRGVLTEKQAETLWRLHADARLAHEFFKSEVVAALEGGGSFSEVARVTGLSTNTLQRWKREAGR